MTDSEPYGWEPIPSIEDNLAEQRRIDALVRLPTARPHGPVTDTTEPPALIRMDERPSITRADFRRMRSISLNLAAYVENHCDGNEGLKAQIVELRGIINGGAA